MEATMVGRRYGVLAMVLGTATLAAACGGSMEEERDGTSAAARLQRAPDPAKELVIVDPSVIASPEETTFDPQRPSGNDRRGAWTFGRLVHNMLPSGQRDDRKAASDFVTSWLQHWDEGQSPNPAVSPSDARPNIRALVLGPWRAASGCATDDAACTLDMAKAPFQLLAIVNRPDLRIVADDDTAIGGEGRFVFQLVGPRLGWNVPGGPVEVLDATASPQKFNVIFEYSLPVRSNLDTLRWAQRWHDLGAVPFGEGFNAVLRSITSDFAGPDQDLRRPNGNALDQLRTNEVATQGARRFGAELPLSAPQIWELREFRLSAGTGRLAQHTVNLEPSRDFDIARPASVATFRAPFGTRSPELASWLVDNADAVLSSRQIMPPSMAGNSALIGSGGFGPWGRISTAAPHSFVTAGSPPVRVADAVRDRFALDTCAGCHRHESATPTPHFMHISDRRAIDAVDQTTLALPPATTPAEARAIVLSPFLLHEIAAPSAALPNGGPRYEDFTEVLDTKPRDLKGARGRRPCR
jgi:hypothetical protein